MMMITNNKKVVKNMTEKVYQLVFSAVLLENRFPFFFLCFRTGANGLRIDFDCTRSDSVKVYKSSFFVLLIWLSVYLRIVELVICD